MKVYVVPDENETKFQRFKRTLDTKWRETKRWVSDNKEILAVVVPAVIGGAATIVKVAGRHHNLQKQEAVKNRSLLGASQRAFQQGMAGNRQEEEKRGTTQRYSERTERVEMILKKAMTHRSSPFFILQGREPHT